MFNNHELRIMALRQQKRAIDRIPIEEDQEALQRTKKRLEKETAEYGFLLRSAVKEGVPIGDIREAIGAKNWKTWARVKREYNVGGAN